MHDVDRVRWRLAVRPEPTDEEAAALVVALLSLSVDSVPAPTNPEPSRWAMAGRHATRSGIASGSRLGWGRQAERR
ncbi:MAG: hypothetical protein M3Q71_05185 [Chloroflexota bacterium]|nr:hypothetical protein [Chloroflexota bacterium]MDP9470048.1 hypothetical protein [Chloroflexota bacterium]